MTHISFVNQLYGDEALKREHRQHARFINTAFTVTLLGAVVSDQLEDGRVLSGVGGQYNFVSQAHELAGARSIILVRAVRDTPEGVGSNIVWSYGHTTIPRHLRDMVVTEYGIADLRNKTDGEVIEALLAVCDSRFQEALLAEAKRHGKIAPDYVIPESHRHNTPEQLQAIYLRYRDCFPDFPLGCDFTGIERRLLRGLGWLKARRKSELLQLVLGNMFTSPQGHEAALARMGLDAPASLKEKLYQRLLIAALNATA